MNPDHELDKLLKSSTSNSILVSFLDHHRLKLNYEQCEKCIQIMKKGKTRSGWWKNTKSTFMDYMITNFTIEQIMELIEYTSPPQSIYIILEANNNITDDNVILLWKRCMILNVRLINIDLDETQFETIVDVMANCKVNEEPFNRNIYREWDGFFMKHDKYITDKFIEKYSDSIFIITQILRSRHRINDITIVDKYLHNITVTFPDYFKLREPTEIIKHIIDTYGIRKNVLNFISKHTKYLRLCITDDLTEKMWLDYTDEIPRSFMDHLIRTTISSSVIVALKHISKFLIDTDLDMICRTIHDTAFFEIIYIMKPPPYGEFFIWMYETIKLPPTKNQFAHWLMCADTSVSDYLMQKHNFDVTIDIFNIILKIYITSRCGTDLFPYYYEKHKELPGPHLIVIERLLTNYKIKPNNDTYNIIISNYSPKMCKSINKIIDLLVDAGLQIDRERATELVKIWNLNHERIYLLSD